MGNIASTKDANEILNRIKLSEAIVILDRSKNMEFLSFYDYTKEEVKDMIYNLRFKDYKYKYQNNDPSIDANYLYVFHQKWSVLCEDGLNELNDIFIKVCYLNKNEKLIICVSFHDKEF